MGLEPKRKGLEARLQKEEKRLVGQQEIDGFRFYRQREFPKRRLHQSSIDAHHGMLRRQHLYFFGTVRMYALVIEKLSPQEQVDSLKKLGHSRMIDHRDIQLPVVGNGVGRLAIPQRVAHAYGHHLALDDVGVDLQMHFIIQSLKNQQDERKQERQRPRAKKAARLAAQVHGGRYETDVHAIQEIAPAWLTIPIDVPHAPQIQFLDAVFSQRFDDTLLLTFPHVPEMGKVVHQPIGYEAQCCLLYTSPSPRDRG